MQFDFFIEGIAFLLDFLSHLTPQERIGGIELVLTLLQLGVRQLQCLEFIVDGLRCD